ISGEGICAAIPSTGTRERWQSKRPLMRWRLPGPQLPAQTASAPVRCASSTSLNGSAPAMFCISQLNDPPRAIVVYASWPPSPTVTQHSTPRGNGILRPETGGGYRRRSPKISVSAGLLVRSRRACPGYVEDTQADWKPCSIKELVGGARRNRTDDLFNAIEALSQLS